ncbi:hypothetical protein ACA351_00725 [Orientia tsutsugamushi]|uniref:hypothetical protein n=1 Tax=Orientia tsutsugamushi TaxID=784 RepID=UPI0035297E87
MTIYVYVLHNNGVGTESSNISVKGNAEQDGCTTTCSYKKNAANLIEQLSLAKNILHAFTIIAEGAEIALSLQQACIRLLSKLENDVE